MACTGGRPVNDRHAIDGIFWPALSVEARASSNWGPISGLAASSGPKLATRNLIYRTTAEHVVELGRPLTLRLFPSRLAWPLAPVCRRPPELDSSPASRQIESDDSA